jgi:hypothetical protein
MFTCRYVPEKDEVQEAVSSMKGLQLKTSIGEDTTLHFPLWNIGTKEVMLMHVTGTLDAIKKREHFQDYEASQALYTAKNKFAKQAKAGPALLEGASNGTDKSKKSSKKAKEAEATTKASDQEMHANFQAGLNKAKEAAENAKGAMTAADNKMFAFYANLLSVEVKYAWNKIVEEHMENDPYVDLQDISQKGPRGLSRQSFDNCVMFHLLTVFPINAAEQEKYYITNILKKPQCVKVSQFVHCVEQLNACTVQMPCLYKSPSVNTTTKLENIPFTEAELGSHVLRMCPLQWEDQYNLPKKGMMPMNLCLLLTSLEAFERVCTQEKAKSESSRKTSNKCRNGKKQSGTESRARVPKRVRFEKHCILCKKHGSTHTTHNTKDCCRYGNDGKLKANVCAAKKGGKKPNPKRQNFAQLSKKLDKLEISLRKVSKISKKCQYEDSNSDSE